MNILQITNMYPTGKSLAGIFIKKQILTLRKQDINVDLQFLIGNGIKRYIYLQVSLLKTPLKT